MEHGHHPLYVVLSIVVSILGSWTALDLHRRVTAHSAGTRLLWSGATALAMGLSIWSMHFIAMLGYRVGVPLSYDPLGTVASLLLAMAATGGAFLFLDRAEPSRGRVLMAAVAMGSGICLMHYMGMVSIRGAVQIAYDPLLVALSLAIAVGASLAGILMILRGGATWLRTSASIGLGFGIFGMHYTGMAAATFTSTAAPIEGGVSEVWLTSYVAAATLLLLLLGLAAAFLDRRRESIAILDARSVAQRERHLRAILGHLPVAVIVADNNTGQVRYTNPEAQRLIGKDVVGLHWPSPATLKAVHADGREYELDEYPATRARRGERLERAAVTYERPDGSRFHAEVTAAPVINLDGSSSDDILAFVDVTERVTAEEALRQGSKMQALGQLTGGIAHDFNNLLTPIVGGLDLIRRMATDERTKRIADNALNAATRGTRLTGQLLAFSRTQRLELKPTLVVPLVKSMHGLLGSTLGPSVQVSFHLDEEACIPVVADATQLELAILNLAINARDAMPAGGSINISARLHHVDGDAELVPGLYVELSVSDSGPGMPPEVRARAFEPFFTTKGPGKGTGLGLSMVYGVAQQSGGTARIRSDAGKGTIVSLFLKAVHVTTGTQDETREKPLDSGTGRAGRILVVDDDSEVRAFLVDSLSADGHEVVEAQDGRRAIEQVTASEFDLLLLDFAMPGMNGAEVAQSALRLNARQQIIFVTGYSESAAIDGAAPGATVLRKPFSHEALTQAVQQHLAQQQRFINGAISAGPG